MALLPANKRDQYLLIVGFLALALAGYYFMNIWQPRSAELDESQAHVDSLVIVNQRAKAELAQGRTQQLKREAERYASDLEVMRLLVPTGNEVPALLEQVSTAARRVGLDIADVQPLPVIAGDQYDAYKYRLSVRGDYNRIGVLLANIGSLQRIVAPVNLTITPMSGANPPGKSARTQQVEARFEIQTYVARTAPPPRIVAAPAAAEAPKPGER